MYTLFSADGVLVLGQEQDEVGAGFSATEAFVGNMSLLNIWDRTMSTLEIRTYTTSCWEYVGTVYAWPDFIAGLKGRLKPLDTRFCSGKFSCFL